MANDREIEEEELEERVRGHHQERVSMMLIRAGVDEERADYLAVYRNVLRELTNPEADDWTIPRAALLHLASAESLAMEHNRWLAEEIRASFEEEAQHYLYHLVLDTRGARPVPRFGPEEGYPNHQMTNREATYYCSRAALAVLSSRNNPGRAIELFEELDVALSPYVRFYLPAIRHSLYLDPELGRLPDLYEKVGRFEGALRRSPVSHTHYGWRDQPADVAIRRLNSWLEQLSVSGGVAEVERCLDIIYEWLGAASQVDEEERDQIDECPTVTRQFWVWYYSHALGRILVGRPSLRESLLDEIEAGEWESCGISPECYLRHSPVHGASTGAGRCSSIALRRLNMVSRDQALGCNSTTTHECPERPLLGHANWVQRRPPGDLRRTRRILGRHCEFSGRAQDHHLQHGSARPALREEHRKTPGRRA